MLAHWIGDVVGLMHKFGISNKQLAAHMDVTPEYISMVLNGHREPSGIEARIRNAIDEITKN
jgi:plasmid maintenance system antidote protein VapI